MLVDRYSNPYGYESLRIRSPLLCRNFTRIIQGLLLQEQKFSRFNLGGLNCSYLYPFPAENRESDLGTKKRKSRTEPKKPRTEPKNRTDQFRFLIRFQKSRNRNNLGQFGSRVRLTELTRRNRINLLFSYSSS
jgi:hypothetical protein